MAITVDSPYSGKPVKVREQDVRRAVRDEEGRIFYVLPRPDGSGFVGSKTRTPARDPQQETAEPMPATADADGAQSPETTTATSPRPASSAAVPTESAPPRLSADAAGPVHDATGRRRKRGWRGRMVIFVLAAIVALLIYLFSPLGPFDWNKLRPPGQSPTPKPNPIPIGRIPPPAIDVC